MAQSRHIQLQTTHKYLWQVGEVRVDVREWVTGSRPLNSFSCCYGNCERRKTKEKRENICLCRAITDTIGPHMLPFISHVR